MANRSAILAIRIIADGTDASKGFDQTASSADKFGKGLNKASAVAVAGLAVMGAGALSAANAASDLGESTNAVQKVFGDASPTIAAFGETAAESAGLSQRAFNELATSTGSLLTNFGYSAQDAADQTTELASRAADMASVFNTDVSTALDAINSGIRGEAEPLRAFGVNLNDASLKAKALELGLYSGKGALDANAKAQAAIAITMEQTSKTAGDFADTSDGLANRQRILTSEWENAQASLGEQLLPYMEQGLGYFSSMIKFVSDNESAVKKLVVGVAALAVAVIAINTAYRIYQATAAAFTVVQNILTSSTLKATVQTIAYNAIIGAVRLAIVIWTAAQWALNVALNANPIGLVVLAIAALVAILYVAWTRSDRFREIVTKAFNAVKGAAVSFGNAVADAFQSALSWLQRVWDKIMAIKNAIAGGIGKLLGAVGLNAAAPATYGAPPSSAGALAYSARSSGPVITGPVTITIAGTTGDPYAIARNLKRALAGYDISQGRTQNAPLAVAW